MKPIKCQDALITMMAVLDAEETEISSQQASAHLTLCQNCQYEFEQMQNTFKLLKKQERRAQDADLWLEIESRLDRQTEVSAPLKWQPFLLLGVFLVAYKLLEMLPERDLGLLFKIVPLIFVAVLFVFLKENPFKVDAELDLEK